MATRRDFMAAMAATTAGSVAAPATAAFAAAPDQLGIFLLDQSLPQAEAFAMRARHASMQVHDVRSDVLALWRRALDPGIGGKGHAFAGLTCPTALFCLERLAWERGMRVVHRVDHVRSTEGRWDHVSAAPISNAMHTRLVAEGDDFGGTAFDILAVSQPFWGSATHAAPPFGTASHTAAPLTSWVIAPRART